MLAVALAAVSALTYGASDFSGAIASKEHNSTVVTTGAQAVSLVALAAALAVIPEGDPKVADLLWGAVGGLGAAYALVTFYRALAIGPMSVAASLTGLFSTVVPVVAGLLLGDRPGSITMLGIAVAIPAAVLVSLEAGTDGATATDRPTGDRDARQTRRLAVSAGLGFGLFFIALARTSADAGLYPLLAARVASVTALGLMLFRRRLPLAIGRRWLPIVAIAGVLDFCANATYLVAVRAGSLTWVAAISSLYPVSTVILARLILKERMAGAQRVGVAAAALALVLVGFGASS